MMRLSPAMTWSRHGTDIYVHGENQVLQLPDCPPAADSLMRALESGCEQAAIETLDIEPARAAAILDTLWTTNCLVQNVSHRWVGTSAERQADYFCALGAHPDEAQAILNSANVAILGLGGIGSVALTHLVSAGVGQYTLIDGDTVAQNNLNRQFIYCPSDEGRRKVYAAADWISSRNPAATVRSVPRMLTDTGALISVLKEGVSLLVVAADSPPDIGVHAAHACLETETALIGADCGLRTASWGPLLESSDLPEYIAELASAKDRPPLPKASRSMTASFGPTNAIAASYLAKDIVSWFAGLPVASRRKKVVINMDEPTAATVDA